MTKDKKLCFILIFILIMVVSYIIYIINNTALIEKNIRNNSHITIINGDEIIYINCLTNSAIIYKKSIPYYIIIDNLKYNELKLFLKKQCAQILIDLNKKEKEKEKENENEK
jgi:hypothetical protein